MASSPSLFCFPGFPKSPLHWAIWQDKNPWFKVIFELASNVHLLCNLQLSLPPPPIRCIFILVYIFKITCWVYNVFSIRKCAYMKSNLYAYKKIRDEQEHISNGQKRIWVWAKCLLIHPITFLKSLPPCIYDFKRPTHFIEELSPKGLLM